MNFRKQKKSINHIRIFLTITFCFVSILFMACKPEDNGSEERCIFVLTHISDTNPPISWLDGLLHPTDTSRTREVAFSFSINNVSDGTVTFNPHKVIGKIGNKKIKPSCHESSTITILPKQSHENINFVFHKLFFDEVGFYADTLSALDLSNLITFYLIDNQNKMNKIKVKKDSTVFVLLNVGEYGDH